jgi:hypothetical protein
MMQFHERKLTAHFGKEDKSNNVWSYCQLELKMISYYPLIGGLMLGSSVHHLLYYNGNILGISGIYFSTLSAISKRLQENTSQIPRSESGSESSSLSNEVQQNVSRAEVRPAPDNGVNSKSEGIRWWKIAFTAGLLVGGGLLRAFGPGIEKNLGISLFDHSSIQLLSKSLLATFLAGALVGVGTKVL